MPTTFIPCNDREAFCHMVECWRYDRSAPAYVLDGEGERIPLRTFLRGWGGDLLPGVYVDLVSALTNCEPHEVVTYGKAARRLLRLLDA